jgi:hypothetical protein
LTKAAASLARNSAALATSQAVPWRPPGQRAPRAASMASRLGYWPAICWRTMGVSISPGRMALARMPWRAYCSATLCVSWFTAALLAWYDA